MHGLAARLIPIPSGGWVFSRILCLLILPTFLQGGVCAQTTKAASPTRKPSPTASSNIYRDPELQPRMTALEAAKQSDDAAAVAKAARLVVASSLRGWGRLQLQAHSPAQAVEVFRRSLDFEDCAVGRMDLAVSYLAAKRLDEALSTATEVLTANPENAQGWYLQGRVWIDKKLYDHAVEALRHSVDIETSSAAIYWLGWALLQTHQPEAAKAIFQKLLNQSTNRALTHARLSDAYREAQYPEDAARELHLAAQLDPGLGRRHTGTSELDADLTLDDSAAWGTTKPAAKVAASPEQRRKQEVELRKILGNALNDLGTAEARQRQFELALAHFHEAETWQPDTPGLQRNIGIAAIRTTDYAEAVRTLRPVVAATPRDDVARMALGSALFAVNNFTETAQTLSPLGDSVVQHPEVAYALAESLVRINKYEGARALLEKMEGTPLSPPMLLLVAQAWSQMGVYPRTVQTCHRALEANPKLATAHYLAGLAFIRQDRAADAAQEFRDELQLDPNNVEAEYNLAFVLLQQSQDEEAVGLLRKVLARNPEHAEANYELGKQLFHSGDAADAIAYLEVAARLKPSFEPVHYQLQAAYRATGRLEDADREAKIYRQLKEKSRNITLPPPRTQGAASTRPD